MLKKFLKFSVVGLSGTIVNLSIYTLLLKTEMNYLLAAVVAFFFAVTNNFYWNFRWTFPTRGLQRSTGNMYLRFFCISVFNLGINLGLLHWFVEEFLFDRQFAQLLAIALVSGLNFLMNLRFTFTTGDAKKSSESSTLSFRREE